MSRASEELVTLASGAAADHKDAVYLTEAGAIRFVEGKAHGIPLSVAQRLAAGRPGWTIEPQITLTRIGRKP